MIENEWIIWYVALAIIALQINWYILQHNKIVILICPVINCGIRVNVDFRQSWVDMSGVSQDPIISPDTKSAVSLWLLVKNISDKITDVKQIFN